MHRSPPSPGCCAEDTINTGPHTPGESPAHVRRASGLRSLGKQARGPPLPVPDPHAPPRCRSRQNPGLPWKDLLSKRAVRWDNDVPIPTWSTVRLVRVANRASGIHNCGSNSPLAAAVRLAKLTRSPPPSSNSPTPWRPMAPQLSALLVGLFPPHSAKAADEPEALPPRPTAQSKPRQQKVPGRKYS